MYIYIYTSSHIIRPKSRIHPFVWRGQSDPAGNVCRTLPRAWYKLHHWAVGPAFFGRDVREMTLQWPKCGHFCRETMANVGYTILKTMWAALKLNKWRVLSRESGLATGDSRISQAGPICLLEAWWLDSASMDNSPRLTQMRISHKNE